MITYMQLYDIWIIFIFKGGRNFPAMRRAMKQRENFNWRYATATTYLIITIII